MQDANVTNLLTLIDSANEDGFVCIHAPNDSPVRNKDEARAYLLSLFMRNTAVTLRLRKVKKAIDEIDLVLAHTGQAYTEVRFNLVKLLQLPGVEPAQELAAYREMVQLMRRFYEAYPQERCSIQLCNHRDRHKRVYGTLTCRVPSKTDAHMAAPDVDATATLKAYIEGSQALVYWLRRMALELQRIGPWSWTIITEDDLFGFAAGPHSKYTWSQLTREASTPKHENAELHPLDF